MEPAAFIGAIKASVIKGDCSNEQFAAFLMVAKEYDLNPLTKEIYAFPDRGGITPIVSIDGWMKLINSHPEFDGMEFEDQFDGDGKLSSVTCRIYRKDRNRPISVTEYMAECFRPTEPWKKWPARMLRHKSAIQCARYAFGFSGIMEPDEYERMTDITPQAVPLADRMAAKRAEQTIAPEQAEGFDLDHVHTTTAQATAEQPEAEQGHEGSGFDAAPSGDTPLQQEEAQRQWDESQQIEGTLAEQHLQEHADPLAAYKAALVKCQTVEEVNNLNTAYSAAINALSKELKGEAKTLRQNRIQELGGAA
nr:recombinase RecT [Roseibium sediminis]